jgi:ribose 1,5-bisphosphokinase PhnN
MDAPLIIVSGPSGSGKSTVISRVLKEGGLPLHKSVSATTRAPRVRMRNGVEYREQDAVDYHFWKRERFLEEMARGAFLEWAEVHGQLYDVFTPTVLRYSYGPRNSKNTSDDCGRAARKTRPRSDGGSTPPGVSWVGPANISSRF